jgi:hypothetical protein
MGFNSAFKGLNILVLNSDVLYMEQQHPCVLLYPSQFCERKNLSSPNKTLPTADWVILVIREVLLFTIFSGFAAQQGQWPPRSRGFLITHNDAPHSVGLLWRSYQLAAETST